MTISINSTTFPDETLRNLVIEYLGSATITDETIEKTNVISVSDSSNNVVKNLKRIEYFSNLETFTLNKCFEGNLTLNNPKLKRLSVLSGFIKSINLRALINLEEFSCDLIASDTVDLSKNTKLSRVSITGAIKTMDLSKNTNLKYVYIRSGLVGGKIKYTGDSEYPYQIDISDYVGKSNINRVVSAQGISTSNNIYSQGILRFKEYPSSNIKYEYDLKIPNEDILTTGSSTTLNVTIYLDPYMLEALGTKGNIAITSGQWGKEYSYKLGIYEGKLGGAFFNYLDKYEGVASYKATGYYPASWSIVSGSLPEGLSLNASTGEILGTPK